jgi:hypothetical protein
MAALRANFAVAKFGLIIFALCPYSDIFINKREAQGAGLTEFETTF